MDILKGMTTKEKMYHAASVICFVFNSLLSVFMMVVILDMLNKIIRGNGLFSSLTSYWISLIVILILKGIFNTVADLAKHFVGFEITGRIREKMTLRLKRFSLGFYTKERLGEISTIIHKDVDNVEMIVAHLWTRMISDFIISIIIGIGLCVINIRLGLAMISLLPIAVAVLIYGIKKNSKLQKYSQDDLANMVSLFVEYSKGIPLLKAFNESTTFESNLKTSAVDFGESSKKIAKSIANYIGKYFVFMELSFAVLVVVGGVMLFKNDIDLFQYLIFIIFSKEFYKPFSNLEGYWINYIVAKDSYNRIMTILKADTIKNPENPQIPKHFDILFKNASFAYEENEFELKNIDIDIGENSLVALVGPSGSGKTTITNLLLRFYDLKSGHIKIGGINIEDIDYNYLLENISIVMQNVILFADTIYENIKVGNKDATRNEVIEAAKKAMIHDFIMTLPDGYDTVVGENGAGLSGGQKQRISIARAFLKDAPIVILDEATSNVDPINERKIQIAISNLAKGRTLIVIAHHLQTIKSADQILVFNEGRIVERGNHNELMAKKGLFKTLWDAQKQAKDWLLCS
ncbi:MAG: ABC transporter ATP-binding protein/permease [Maledivibacter sp.]|jgi:ATP-binding cassette subfamily B protein|nr:ABC transporter ATP-binding protein/permease [Maledivibacter sp.]